MSNKLSEKINKARAGKVFLLSTFMAFSRLKYKKKSPVIYEIFSSAHAHLRLAYVYRNLYRKYRKQLKEYKQRIIAEDVSLPHDRSKIIWIMWQQGMDSAPEIVRMCYQSIKDRFTDEFEIICLDDKNVFDYITLPEHIIDKYNRGLISRLWYADLIRITLLDRYGGTWIDSTIFYSGGNVPEFIFEDDLFFFKWPRAVGKFARLNSYFITACKNNKIIKLTKELFYRYWEKNNYSCDYWLIDDFFEMAANEFPEEFEKITPMACTTMHIMNDYLFKPFDKKVFDAIVMYMPFHKLTWKHDADEIAKEGTLYKYLLSHYPVYEPKK